MNFWTKKQENRLTKVVRTAFLGNKIIDKQGISFGTCKKI